MLASFPGSDGSFPLQDARRAVEDRLRRSRMTHVILRPTCFMEIWLSPLLGFDLANGRALVLGTGRNAASWISFLDVATLAAAALHAPDAANQTLRLGRPAAMRSIRPPPSAPSPPGRNARCGHFS